MSHYKPYPAYRDSGIEWLGQVPEHWSTLRLANIGPLEKGSGGTKEDDADNGMPCVRYGDLYTTYDFLIRKVRKFILPGRACDYTPIKYGDLLFAASGETFEEIGKSAVNLTEGIAYCGGDVIVLRPERKVNPVFLAYAAGSISAQAQKSLMGKGFTVIHIYGNALRDLVIAAPPVTEQESIGVAIERETARIDALIAKKTRFIELLKEKRQALITHAVTKGLNPDVKMRDSGVECIGDVPEHWNAGVLSRIATRTVVGIAEAATHAYAEFGTPILRSTNIRPYRIIGELLRIDADFAEDRESKMIHAGDLITVRTGNAGVTAVIPKELDGCQCFTMLITTLKPGFVQNYYCFWMNSAAAIHYFSIEGWGTAQINISVPILKALPVPIPPMEEQQAIVSFLNRETARIDLLSSKTQRSIDLLKERRSAFITAAVTGQIDLREAA